MECVFPSVAASTNGYCHLIYQGDGVPGLHVRGDATAAGDNNIVYVYYPINVGIDQPQKLITDISQNYPNPFASESTIKVNLSKPAKLGLVVTNFLGQRVLEIPAATAGAGPHELVINAAGLNAGIYFYTVTADKEKTTMKMIVQ